MEQFAQFISMLFASRTQAHIFHLQTDSYAAHKALQEYYEEIIEIADGLVESYQGRYGILRDYSGQATFKEDNQPLAYFEALCKYVETTRQAIPQDSYIQNEVDTLVALIEGTKYKLKFLH